MGQSSASAGANISDMDEKVASCSQQRTLSSPVCTELAVQLAKAPASADAGDSQKKVSTCEHALHIF